jgi:hypothetical protein
MGTHLLIANGLGTCCASGLANCTVGMGTISVSLRGVVVIQLTFFKHFFAPLSSGARAVKVAVSEDG